MRLLVSALHEKGETVYDACHSKGLVHCSAKPVSHQDPSLLLKLAMCEPTKQPMKGVIEETAADSSLKFCSRTATTIREPHRVMTGQPQSSEP